MAAMGFPSGSNGEEFAYNAEDLGSIPGLEGPLEKGKATHSSILAWRIPWTVCSPWGYKESNKTERLSLSLIKLHFSRFDFSSVIHIIHQFFK